MKDTTSRVRAFSVSAPAAGVAQVHEMRMEGDIMKMRALTEGSRQCHGTPGPHSGHSVPLLK